MSSSPNAGYFALLQGFACYATSTTRLASYVLNFVTFNALPQFTREFKRNNGMTLPEYVRNEKIIESSRRRRHRQMKKINL
jgi:hypothetical protein